MDAIGSSLFTKVLLRFVAGAALTVATGFAIFPDSVFLLERPTSQLVTAGLLAAGILALVRVGRPVSAWGLTGAKALLDLGLAWDEGWIRVVLQTAGSLLIGGGIFLAAVVYDSLARRNIRFGKFLVLGSLVAGTYFAATPLTLIGRGLEHPVGAELMLSSFLGLVIGDAVGLGVELVELLPWLSPGPIPRTPRIVSSRADVPDSD